MSNFPAISNALKVLVHNRQNDELKTKVDAAVIILDNLDTELSRRFENQGEIGSLMADMMDSIVVETMVSDARKKLHEILPIATGANKTIGDLAHKALIELAMTRPLNDEDPVSMEDIDHNALIKLAKTQPLPANDPAQNLIRNLVGIARGDVYDINILISWHNQRPRQRDEREDVHLPAGLKKLIDPVTNEPFPDRDVAHIRAFAALKGLRIDDLFVPNLVIPAQMPQAQAANHPQQEEGEIEENLPAVNRNPHRFFGRLSGHHSFFAPPRRAPSPVEVDEWEQNYRRLSMRP